MKRSWILVANSARARLFELDDAGALAEVQSYINMDGHSPDRSKRNDRLPRAQESSTSARHAIEPHLSEKDKSHQAFARLLCEGLEDGRVKHRFDGLVLVAAPRFLGQLHQQLGKQLIRLVEREIHHDFTALTAVQLSERLVQAQRAAPTAAQVGL